MKKILFVFAIFSLTIVSCGETKKEDVKKEIESPKKEEVKEAPKAAAGDDVVALGEKLFTDKTCVSCHQLDAKIVGPSVKDIVKIYEDNNASLVAFLKGEKEAIVDTDPGQVAIMKANLDGFVKDLKQEELEALAAYMKSAK
ncbi:c-type cytochrome [Lutimonas sp.]|uniref:c-type cytochrome n=1 Tax=Lutimonas sp. TaxID=1872403 RepID=UPI003D9B09C5